MLKTVSFAMSKTVDKGTRTSHPDTNEPEHELPAVQKKDQKTTQLPSDGGRGGSDDRTGNISDRCQDLPSGA